MWSCLKITGVNLQISVMNFCDCFNFLLGQLLCLQMIQYVQEIQWTLLQFDISFYSVFVYFCESPKTLCIHAHHVRQEFYPILLSWELSLPGTSEIIVVITHLKTSLAE